MTDKTAPERIWLNTAGSYADAYEATVGSETGVTWCDTPQDDDDQEYVRADLGSFYQEKDIDALMACRDALRQIVNLGGAYGSRAWMAEADRIAREALANTKSREPKS